MTLRHLGQITALLAVVAACDATAPPPHLPTPAQVNAALAASCGAGDRSSCLTLARTRAADAEAACYGAGRVVKNSRDLIAPCDGAAAAYQTACDVGTQEDCAHATAMRTTAATLRRAEAVRVCRDEAVSVCQATCDGGDVNACIQLALIYTSGERVPHDVQRGIDILFTACHGGSIDACYMHGAITSNSPADAIPSLSRVCESDEPGSSEGACGMLVTMLDRGDYAPPLGDRIALFRRICTKDIAKSPEQSRSNACGRLKDLGGKL